MRDSYRRRGVGGAAVLVAWVLLVFVAVPGCSFAPAASGLAACEDVPAVNTAANITYKTPLLPVKVSLSSSGKITLSLTAEWVTPLGTFSLSGEASHSFAKKQNSSYLLVVRAVEDGKMKETGYEIDCHRQYRAFLNGDFVEEIGLDRTTINVKPGTASTIVVVDAAADVDPDLRPLPEFQSMPSKGFTFPDPIAHYGLGVDLDTHEPNVDEYVAGSRYETGDADLWYEYGTGLKAGYDASFGRAGSAHLTAEECRDEARSNAVGALEVDDFAVGKRFCVFTSAGNVTLLTMTGFHGPYSDRYTVTFAVTARWQKIR